MSRSFGIEVVDQPVADVDVAAGDLDQAGDDVERGRLAAAGRPDQGDELAVLDRERDVVDGDHVAVALDQILQTDLSHAQSLRQCDARLR